MTDPTAGSAQRSSSWSSQVPIGCQTGRLMCYYIGDKAAIPATIYDDGVKIPTTTGIYFAAKSTAVLGTDLSETTVGRILQGFVATGVLLREKDPTFLKDAGVRKKVHNASPAYYLNDRAVAEGTGAWLPLAFAVAMGHLNKKGKPDTSVSYNVIEKDAEGKPSKVSVKVLRDDYGPDLLTAMARLVPADMFPQGYSSADALQSPGPNGGGRRSATDDDDDDDGPEDPGPAPARTPRGKKTTQPKTARPAVSPASDETPEVTPTTRAAAPVTPEPPAAATGGGWANATTTSTTLLDVSEPDEVTAKRTSRAQEKALKSLAAGVIQRFHDESTVTISAQRGKAWWATMHRRAAVLLDEGVDPDALVAALVSTHDQAPPDWMIRKALEPSGSSTSGTFRPMEAANRGGTAQSRADYEAADAATNANFGFPT